jgi:hypothetical protein
MVPHDVIAADLPVLAPDIRPFAQQLQPLHADGTGIACACQGRVHSRRQRTVATPRASPHVVPAHFSADLPALDKAELLRDTIRAAALRSRRGSDVELPVSAAAQSSSPKRPRETVLRRAAYTKQSIRASPVASAIVELMDASGTIIGQAPPLKTGGTRSAA